VFLNIGSESESESINKIKNIPRYTSDQSDSYIVFEDSGRKESELTVDNENDDESTTDATENETGSNSYANKEISEDCLSAWGEESKRKRTLSTTDCHSEKKKLGHRRPMSLDISSCGAVELPKVSRMYLFIQMQLCQRQSLREWLRDNVCDRQTSKVLIIFEQILQAVEYVHLQGLIHRDLKVII
jgi:Serine/threonine protein kinase